MIRNTAGQKIGAQLVSATDGSAFTSAVTAYVTGDAGTQAVGSVGAGACVHEGGGYHTYAPAIGETDYALVAFTFTGSGAVPATVQIYPSSPQTGDAYGEIVYIIEPALDSGFNGIVARLGAWGGTGINTVLGAFRALAAKAAGLTPTNLSTGTGFNNTTDSLEALADNVDGLAGTPLTVVSPLAQNSNLTLVRGDDYYNADGRAITFTFVGAPDITGATARFKWMVGGALVGTTGITGTVTSSATCYFEFSSTNTTQTPTHTGNVQTGIIYRYDAEFTLANTHVCTLAQGELYLKADQRP